MTPDHCPKFISCRAPICPFDPYWHIRKHFPGEPVCHWLLEAAKPGAEANFNGARRGEMFRDVSSVALSVAARHAPIRRALERAARYGSRLGQKAPGRAVA